MTRALLTVAAALLVACSTPPAPLAVPPPTAPPRVNLRVLVTQAVSGTPLSGAHVCAARATGAEACADTGKDGAAALDGTPGTYFVRVRGPAEQRWQEAQRVADLATGDAALWIEIAPLRRIS